MSRTQRRGNFWKKDRGAIRRDKKAWWKPDGLSKRLWSRQFRARVRDAMVGGRDPPTSHRHNGIWNWL